MSVLKQKLRAATESIRRLASNFYLNKLGPAMDLYMNHPVFSKGTEATPTKEGCDRCWWFRGHVISPVFFIGLFLGIILF